MKNTLPVILISILPSLVQSNEFYPFSYAPLISRSSSDSPAVSQPMSNYYQVSPHGPSPFNPFSNHVSLLINRLNRQYFKNHHRRRPDDSHLHFDDESEHVHGDDDSSRKDANIGFLPLATEAITGPLKKQDYNYLIWPILFAVLFPFLLGALFLPLALIFLLNLLSLLLVVRQNQSGMVYANPTNRFKRPRRSAASILSPSINHFTKKLIISFVKYNKS